MCLSRLSDNGRLGFICPNKFWQSSYGANVRRLIAEGRHLQSILDFGDQQVFRGATTYTAIHVFTKRPNSGGVDYARIDELVDGAVQCKIIDEADDAPGGVRFSVRHPVADSTWSFVDRETEEWCTAIRDRGPTLGEVAEVFVGVQTSADAVYHVDVLDWREGSVRIRSRRDGSELDIEPTFLRPLVSGADVEPFTLGQVRQAIIYPYEWRLQDAPPLVPFRTLTQRAPRTAAYLSSYESVLRDREGGAFDDEEWFRFGRSQNIGRQRSAKLCVPRLAAKIRCAFDHSGECCLDNVDVNGVRLRAEYREQLPYEYLCAVLNSEVADRFVKSTSRYRFRGGFMSYNKQFIEGIPIVLPTTPATLAAIASISESVRVIAEAGARVQKLLPNDPEAERIRRSIEARRIAVDRSVSLLYGSEATVSR